jgi:hypothetical protein
MIRLNRCQGVYPVGAAILSLDHIKLKRQPFDTRADQTQRKRAVTFSSYKELLLKA